MVRAQEGEQKEPHRSVAFLLSTKKTGCGAVRLAYTAGGRVVAGSNPVIPTKRKSDLQLQITFFVSNSQQGVACHRGLLRILETLWVLCAGFWRKERLKWMR